jgi:acetyl-CoA C-acetyltransferase
LRRNLVPQPVLVAGARTPIGRLLGSLSALPATALGAAAIRAALDRSGITGDQVDAVIMGNVVQAGVGPNPARLAAAAGGVPMSVPATTVNKLCLSGLASIAQAAMQVASGYSEVVLAGGLESMSNAPHLLPGVRAGLRYGGGAVEDALDKDALVCGFDGLSMGAATERYQGGFGFTREDQDAFAAESHARAADAITAGSASQLSDGACAVVVMSKERAGQLGLPWLAEIGAYGTVAGPDPSLLLQPAGAVRDALRRDGTLGIDDLDLLEINEAFAGVALASARDLGVSADRVNVNGGAIALGHPVGMSGARLVLTLALELRRRGGGTGVAALCGGGGQGDALIVGVPRQ